MFLWFYYVIIYHICYHIYVTIYDITIYMLPLCVQKHLWFLHLIGWPPLRSSRSKDRKLLPTWSLWAHCRPGWDHCWYRNQWYQWWLGDPTFWEIICWCFLWYVADDMIMIYFDDIICWTMFIICYDDICWIDSSSVRWTNPTPNLFFSSLRTVDENGMAKATKVAKNGMGPSRPFLRWSWASLCGCRSSQRISAPEETGLGDQSFQGAGDLSALSGDAEDHSPSAAIWKSPLKENDLQIMFINFLSKNCQTCWRPRSGSSTRGTQRFHAELVLRVPVDTRIRCVANFENLAVALSCWADKANCGSVTLDQDLIEIGKTTKGRWLRQGFGSVFPEVDIKTWFTISKIYTVHMILRTASQLSYGRNHLQCARQRPWCTPQTKSARDRWSVTCHDLTNGTPSDLQYHSATVRCSCRYACQMLKNGGTLKSNTWWLLPSQKKVWSWNSQSLDDI